ncbi:MAG: hypothetical protein HRF50_12765 [Phycisphaerae bacterium]|jgi:hypothetical protein
MTGGQAVRRYQVAATMRDGVVEWSLWLETDDGQKHALRIRDGEEIPVLVDLLRRDKTVYYDAAALTLRSGWSAPGLADSH